MVTTAFVNLPPQWDFSTDIVEGDMTLYARWMTLDKAILNDMLDAVAREVDNIRNDSLREDMERLLQELRQNLETAEATEDQTQFEVRVDMIEQFREDMLSLSDLHQQSQDVQNLINRVRDTDTRDDFQDRLDNIMDSDNDMDIQDRQDALDQLQQDVLDYLIDQMLDDSQNQLDNMQNMLDNMDMDSDQRQDMQDRLDQMQNDLDQLNDTRDPSDMQDLLDNMQQWLDDMQSMIDDMEDGQEQQDRRRANR
jgi:hypothetical protein